MPIRYKRCPDPPRGCGEPKLLSKYWKDPKEADGHQRYCAECVKRTRKERADRRASGEELPAISDERRQQMSENAKQLHAEGRLGGSKFGKLGGRPRKPRIADAVLEYFRDPSKLDLIIAAYESNLRSRNRSSRLKAAEAINALEFAEDKRSREARGAGKSPEEMTGEELQEFLEQGLAAMIESGDFDPNTITLPDSAIQEVA